MGVLKVICSVCGYQGTVARRDHCIECPICNSRGTLQITGEQREELMRKKIKAHILEGFKKFGIEKTLECIEDERYFSSHMKEIYKEEIHKMYKGGLKTG